MDFILSSVLETLSTIITQEIQFLGGLGLELQTIKDEFQQMQDFLRGADLLVQDYPDVKSWVAQVRDVAYDVEDNLDEFVMCFTYRHSMRWCGVFRKMYFKSVGAIAARRRLATRIQEIKNRISSISETHVRYKTQYQSLLPEQVSSSRFPRRNNMQYDKRNDALLLEESDLVGIEVPKKELIALILDGDDRRTSTSVVCMGGLGKTTLVRNIYNDVSFKSHFKSHVWVTVSESFKLEVLFKNVIKEIFKEEGRAIPQDMEGMDINGLKDVVKDALQTKKYIVVFDDVWRLDHWNAIHLAFPRNELGSRIVLTTRNREVGEAARASGAGGFVYSLKLLTETGAMCLFCRKAFSGAISCPEHLEEICAKILLVCEGLPLAIEVIGSILAIKGQTKEQWELFYKRLRVDRKHNSQLDKMTELLSLSYYDLPNHLKICFLYLSIFPEDAMITKDYLVRLWIAEGFVERINDMTVEEIAESYLNELVDRCLVQVATTDGEGNIMRIRVHDMIRHIILLKASEQNLTTIFHGGEMMSLQNNVRRLVVHGSITGNLGEAQRYCKSLRSLVSFGSVGGNISEILLYNLLSRCRKLVKVLDLGNAELERIPDDVFKLFHLKYLNLKGTKVKYVPKSIGMLQSLQTLDLTHTYVKKLPIETQKLQHLRHLLLPLQGVRASFKIGKLKFPIETQELQHLRLLFVRNSYLQRGVRVPFKIGKLKSLQTLSYIEAGEVDNIKTVTEIGKLVELRELGITKLKREDGKELCSSLGNLTQLRKLTVYSINMEEAIDFEDLKSSHLPRLQLLSLKGCLKKHPEWISSLHGLTNIDLRNSKLSEDPLQYLHDLPNLITLYLNSRAYEGDNLWLKAGGFPKLENLYLWFLEELRWVTVEENAMLSLRVLYIFGCRLMEDIPTGIENLKHLQELKFSYMSDEFVNKLKSLNKESEVNQRLLQVIQFL